METVILKPKDILQHVCESEERLWTQRDASECSVNQDLGHSILGECKCLKKIHNQFSSLDKRKCCLSLTVCRTTFSNFRVVRNDGRDSGIEEGAMMKTPSDNLPLVPELNEKEFRVFRYAYMCASYPVLGAPDPPSPQTPPVTPTELGRSRFHFKDIKPHEVKPLSHQDSTAEDEASIVPAETLYELLRRIFRLCQNTFYQYEIYIRDSYSKRDAETNRILAEEMVGQLAALENNSNPFYKPKLFMTQFGYDRWQRKQFNHIAELMRKFWHVSHPQKRNNHIQFLELVHDDYVRLMEKLLRYESAYRIAENTQITLLSSASVRLLREFGLRYGIGESYRRIVYLRYLVTNFDHSVWFIQHCTNGVISLLEILPNNEDMVRKELEILTESVRKLQSIVLSTLSKMKNIFPDNKPPGGIESLINLIEKTLEAKVHLRMPKIESLNELIVHCIKEIFPSSYNEMKIVAFTDLKQERNGSLTPTLLNMLIGKIRDEVQNFKTYYEGVFNRFCSVTAIAAQSLYTMFMDDLLQFFKIHHSQPVTTKINRQLLGLGYRLHQLDEDWSTYISGHPSSQLWRESFHKESLHWLSILRTHIQQNTLMAISSDQFTGQTFDELGSAYQISVSSMSSPRDRSFSLKSITPSVNSAFSGLASSNSTPVYNNIWNSHIGAMPQPQPQSLFTKPKTSHPEKEIHFIKEKPGLEPDTRSLDGFHDAEIKHLTESNETDFLTFGTLRSCSSLPDKLSKSYDHYLTVSRTFGSFSQQIENSNNHEKGKDTLTASKFGSSSPLSEKNITAFSPIVNVSLEKETEMENVSEDKKETDYEEDDSVSDLENDHSDSEHSVDFSFPKITEVAKTPDTDQQRQITEHGKRKKIPVDDPRPKKIVPLIPYSHSGHTIIDNSSRPTIHRPVPRSNEKTVKPETPVSTLSIESKVKKKAVLPVSSSILDIIVILQRLMEFSQTLCMTFLQRNITNSSGMYPTVSVSTLDMRKKMFEAHSEIGNHIFCMYVDNMLCFDLCGTTRREAIRLAGPMLMDHLQKQRDRQLIWGCRHNLRGEKNCFRYLDSRAELLCDRYEPVTKDMCTRINNICVVLEYIEGYFQQLEKVYNLPTEGRPKFQQQQSRSSDGDRPQIPTVAQSNVDIGHISAVIRVQCRMMAYRINLFIHDAVTVLISLKRPSVPMNICLIPLTQFLQSYMHSLREWLYVTCYKRVMEYLWIFMVQNFQVLVFEVLRGGNGSIEYAQLLIQAFTHLLKFMTEQRRAIRISLLLPQAEDVMFKLQLCATPTKQLITLYKHVKDYCNKFDASSMYNSDFTLQLIQHKLREDLLKYRKCFSGTQLVRWILQNSDLVKQLGLAIEWTDMSSDIAVLVGRRFLECQLILDTESYEEQDIVSDPELETSFEHMPEEYPKLSILDQVVKEDCDSSDSDATPTTTTRTIPTTNMLQRSNRSYTGITSPVQLLREKHQFRSSEKPVRFEYSCDTPMSFSTMFSDSEGPIFENCDTHYYVLASITSLHNTEKHDSVSELNTLVDQCFQSRISPDYLLHIIYSRRKTDVDTKIFLQNQPLAVLKKLKGDLHEQTSCEIS